MDKEENIVFESNHFYIYKNKKIFEIRKHNGTHSLLIGSHYNFEKAKRFVERAELYHEKF